MSLKGLLRHLHLGHEAHSHHNHPELASHNPLVSNNQLPATPHIASDEILLTSPHRTDGTYPRLVRLSSGTILASFTRIDASSDVQSLVVSASSDGGRSFVERGIIASGTGDIDNAYLLEVASQPSTILAAFRNHDLNPHTGAVTHYRLTICGSPDEGRSWAFFSHPVQTDPAQGGVWEPMLRLGLRHDVQLSYSQEIPALPSSSMHDSNDPSSTSSTRSHFSIENLRLSILREQAQVDQRPMFCVSQNRGISWSKPLPMATGPHGHSVHGGVSDGLLGIATTRDRADGRQCLVLVTETTRHTSYSIEAMVSYDDGATYRGRHEVYTPYDQEPSPQSIVQTESASSSSSKSHRTSKSSATKPYPISASAPQTPTPQPQPAYPWTFPFPHHSAGAPQIAAFPADGSLVCVFMTDEDVPVTQTQWSRHASVKAVFAAAPMNGQIRWGPPMTIAHAECYWPGAMAVGQRRILVVYDRDGPKGRMVSWK